jgi:hypothetical protein
MNSWAFSVVESGLCSSLGPIYVNGLKVERRCALSPSQTHQISAVDLLNWSLFAVPILARLWPL